MPQDPTPDENASQFEENPELKNSMAYWYPRIKRAVTDLDDIETPDTIFVDIERLNVYEIAHNADEPMSDAEIDEIAQCPANWDDKPVKQAADQLGYPAFIRTDTDSAKHNLNDASKLTTDSIDAVHDTVDSLIRATAHKGGMGPRFNFLAVREWIDIDHDFSAFDGTPIGPEVRVFVRDGTVECHHFYWPFDNPERTGSIEQVDTIDSQSELDDRLETLERIVDDAMNTQLRDAAEHIATEFDGYWSLDFALTTDDTWYVIDADRGDDSWHPRSCEHTESIDDEIEELDDLFDEDEVDELLD